MPRTQISFQPGEFHELALKFPTGKRYGERALFSTDDDRLRSRDEDRAGPLLVCLAMFPSCLNAFRDRIVACPVRL